MKRLRKVTMIFSPIIAPRSKNDRLETMQRRGHQSSLHLALKWKMMTSTQVVHLHCTISSGTSYWYPTVIIYEDTAVMPWGPSDRDFTTIKAEAGKWIFPCRSPHINYAHWDSKKWKKKNTTTSLFADDSNEGETPSSSQGSHSPVIGTSGSTSEGSDSDEFGAEPVLMPSQYSIANQQSLPRKWPINRAFLANL